MSSIDKYLGTRYKLSSSENFDEFMKELGVGFVTRKIGNAVSPVISLLKEEDTYTLKTESTFKCVQISFKPGEEFDEETVDGRQVKSVITIEGDTMTHVQDGEKKATLIRKFSEDQVVCTMIAGNITCTRTYSRVE